MKILKGVSIFIILNVLLGACFEEPEFAVTPEIVFQKIEFVEVGGASNPDSLIIYIDFRDGDGDLGISPVAIDSPYHSTNFMVNVGQNRVKVATSPFPNSPGYVMKSTGRPPQSIRYAIYFAPLNSSTLFTLDNRIELGLPDFVPPYTCTANHQAYLPNTDTIYVGATYKHILDPTWIVDTLVNNAGGVVAYAALNRWYIEANPDHYNITVRFFRSTGQNTFTEYDFRKELCTTFDGRFPILAEQKRPLEGSLRYAMVGTGFLSTFSINLLKLEIQVKDRNLNRSNTVETGTFTLNDIRRR